jgi:hypothetical protein
VPLNNEKKSSKRRCWKGEQKGVIVSATTTYCQLGTACTKAQSVGKIFKNIKCVYVCMYVWHYRRDPTGVICLGQPREWDYESLY